MKIREFTTTADAAREEMLATPCPYCADPTRFQGELNEQQAQREQKMYIARTGKFWKHPVDRTTMHQITTRFYGDHWKFSVTGKSFSPRFKDFTVVFLSFENKYNPWHWASYASLFRFTANPAGRGFDVCRIMNRKSTVVVDGHTWFNHGSVITVHGLPRTELKSADTDVMQEAMEFFREERRGGGQVKEVDVVRAIQKLKGKSTQKAVAEEVGVTLRTIQRWAAHQGKSWEEIKNEAAHILIV